MRTPVVAGDPAVAIARGGEVKRVRRSELITEPPLDLVAEPRQPAVCNRVLEARVFAVGAVAEVALHRDDLFGDLDGLWHGAEAQQVGEAREGLDLIVRHAHPAANGEVEANELARGADNGDVSQILGEKVDVVARGHGDGDLEFSRQVGFPVNGLVLGFAAADELIADPEFVVGMGAGEEVLADGASDLVDLAVQRRLLGVGVAHDISIHVTAGGDRIEQRMVDAVNGAPEVSF